MEDFYTIQGEGFYQGYPAHFIRLGGCDVGCTWCDVKESWEAIAHPQVHVSEIVRRVDPNAVRIAVVTGGEPAMYDLTELTACLKARGVRTHLETSGAYPVTGMWDWICLSPKKFKPPIPGVYQLAHELKIIVYNKSDLDWATGQAAKVRSSCQLFLQPEWSREDEMLSLVVDFVKANPKWKISLQIHKYINVP